MSEKTKDEPIVEEAPQEEVLEELKDETFSLPENDNELEKAKAEASEWKDKYLRAHADFENTKKRLNRDKSTAISYANESFSKDILAVMDSFDQALLSISKAEEETEDKSEVIDKMKEGVTLTYEQLKKILEKNSIIEIESEGEFDPNLHQVIMQVDSDEHEEGHIVQVMQKGFMIKDRVLRPSMVSTKK